MFSVVKFIIAVIVVAQTASAFVPITAGPSLDAKKGKIAGIGGMDGPKPPSSGGVGAFKVGAKAKETPKKKITKKANNTAKAANPSKIPNFFIKTPWTK